MTLQMRSNTLKKKAKMLEKANSPVVMNPETLVGQDVINEYLNTQRVGER